MPRVVSKKDRSSEAERLRKLREKLGISQQEMARYFRVSPGSIAFWENRQRTIPGPVLLLMDLFEEELRSAPFPEVFLNPPLKLGIRRALNLTEPLVKAGVSRARSMLGLGGPVDPGEFEPGIALQVAIARQVVESLNEAKGLPVKVGQMLSYFDFNMPFPVKEVFASLRNQGIPMNPLSVAQVVQEDLGGPPSKVFVEWEAKPFAAASIGQVHRARLPSGERVAIKVQYPGVRETLESDMDSISILGKLSQLILRGSDGSNIITEIREHLLQECDYRMEADFQDRFREIFRDHPVIRIPEVYRQFSSGRVLATRYYEGQTLEQFAATASQEARNRIGEAIWDYFNIPKYRLGIFNCDPHAGNFMVCGEQLVCFDFGSVKQFSDAYFDAQKRQALGIARQDREVLRQGIEGMGVIKNTEAFNFEAHFHFLAMVGTPFQESSQPFQYTEEFRKALWGAVQTNPNRDHTALPKEEVMSVRSHFGELAVLSMLRAQAHWRQKLLALVS